jgi:predicted MFS family arabinose efflux permease
MFGIFFFLTIFVQEVLGYSALKAGLAFLPFAGVIIVMSGIVSQIIARTGARSLMLIGTSVTAVGMYWFSHISVSTTYLNGLLGPMLVTASGLGMLFVPLSLVALTRVRNEDSGVASSLLNTGQQVGGAVGLAALGTVTWTAVANSIKHQAASAAAAGHVAPTGKSGTVPASIIHEALATGISRGFVVAAGIAVLALVIVAITIRIPRSELAGAAAAVRQGSQVEHPRPEPELSAEPVVD